MSITSYNSALTNFFLGHETVFGTAVNPVIEIPLLSEDMSYEAGALENKSMRGNIWARQKGARYGATSASGTYTFEVYPNLVGELMKWAFRAPVTTGSSPDYTHTFTPDATINCATTQVQGFGNVPFRFFGTVANSITFKLQDMTWIIEIETFSKNLLSVNSLKTGVASSDTAITLNDQDGNFIPTAGLLTTDSLILSPNETEEETVAISAITDPNIDTSTVTNTHAVGSPVVLAPITPTNPTTVSPFNFGRTTLTINGVTFEAQDGFEIKIVKNISQFSSFGSRSDFAQGGLGKSSVEISGLDRVYNGQASLLDSLKENKSVSNLVLTMESVDIPSGSSPYSMTVTVPSIILTSDLREGKKASDNEQTALDSFTAEAEYDSGIGGAIEFELKNDTASY